MGIRLSHGDFSMAYSAFNRWRKFILESLGGSYPPHTDKTLSPEHWYWNTDNKWNSQNSPGLLELLKHEDCEGYISPGMCKLIILELEKIMPHLESESLVREASGHILGNGGFMQVTYDFIHSCNEAYNNCEHLEFG